MILYAVTTTICLFLLLGQDELLNHTDNGSIEGEIIVIRRSTQAALQQTRNKKITRVVSPLTQKIIIPKPPINAALCLCCNKNKSS
jgi:hypothetical protein